MFDLSKLTKNNFIIASNYSSAMRYLITYDNRKCKCGEKLLHIKNSKLYNEALLWKMYGEFNSNINYDVLYDDITKFIHSKTNCSEI